jgi:hypothetical protein
MKNKFFKLIQKLVQFKFMTKEIHTASSVREGGGGEFKCMYIKKSCCMHEKELKNGNCMVEPSFRVLLN